MEEVTETKYGVETEGVTIQKLPHLRFILLFLLWGCKPLQLKGYFLFHELLIQIIEL